MSDHFANRQQIIRILILAIGSILFLRIAKLQIFDDYGLQAENQSIIRKPIFPARGALVDRNGKTILNNTIVYNLVIVPKHLSKDLDTVKFCEALGITDSTFKESYRRAALKELNRNKPITILKDLSEERVAALQEIIYNYTGIELVPHTIRSSPYACGGLVIGYTGEVSTDMLKKEKYKIYTKGDYVGITGLENYYEEILRGQIGVSYYTRDNLNRPTGKYKNGDLDTIAIKGKDLNLYMDIELEQYTEKLMSNKLGSAVAIDPRTGGILAMVSTPSFDPNIVNAPDKSAKMYKMLTDATKPLFNRAVLGKYPPGSTFKPLSALVALDEGVATAATGYPCGGRYSTCGGKIKCTHAGGGHAANLRNAMGNSCNSYFCHMYKLALDNPVYGGTKKGFAKWRDYMTNFGLGAPTGVDLPQEIGGGLPTVELYDRMYNGNWNACNNSMLGMGQGELELTPIQLANAMCIIANKGYYYTPHFVKNIGGDSTHPMLKKYLQKHQAVHIPDSAFEAVFDGMEYVVTNGTGTVAKIPDVRVCAKTGTVENYGPLVMNGKPVKNKNHSMFVAFAPRENPKICVAVCIENAGFGATWAGPIASLMIQKYLKDSIPPARKGLEKKMFTSNVIPSMVYLVDSLRKQKDKAIQDRKAFVKDSTARYKRILDSLRKARGLVPNDSAPKKKSPFKIFSQIIIPEPYGAKKRFISKG
jgi:penicillin-binding protein 2